MDFQNKVNELAHNDNQLQVRSLTFLSDLSIEDLSTLTLLWPAISRERRRTITTRLGEVIEDNIEYNFCRFFQLATEDSDPEVREAAIEGLWEDTSTTTLRLLLERLASDPEPDVQAAAAQALSRFAYLAELGKLRNDWPERLRTALLKSAQDRKLTDEVRRRSLEALSYLSDDPTITELLANAYRGDVKMKASAVLGMGRSMDERWEPILLHELRSDDPELRFEAARAVGELGKSENVPVLIPLLEDDDLEVQLATIWSLGQLGGRVAEQQLEGLKDSESTAITDAVEAALDELRLGNDPLRP